MRTVAVFPSDRRVEVIEQPEPHITHDRQVLLRMLEVGICGTDREICAFEYGQPPPGTDRLILGHESLARVEQVGDAVEAVQRGDLAVVMVRRPCPHRACIACRAGRSDFCMTGDFIERGIKAADGFLAEKVVEDERFVVALPPSIGELGVLVEPLTIAVKGLEQLENVQRRLPWFAGRVGVPSGVGAARLRHMTAVVLGAGSVGLLGALALIDHGFDTWVYSREPRGSARAELAASFGAHYESSENTPLAELAGHVGHIDVIFEAVGSARLSADAVRALGANGVLVFTGIPPLTGSVALEMAPLMRQTVLKNQVILGTVNAGREAYEQAAFMLERFAQRFPLVMPKFITRRRPIGEFASLLPGSPDAIKDVVVFEGASA